MTQELVEYRRMTAPGGQVRLSQGCLYQYVWASNGIFIYSENSDFRVLAPIKMWDEKEKSSQVRGLTPLFPYIHLNHSKVGTDVLMSLLTLSFYALPNEFLQYVYPHSSSWKVFVPDQKTSLVSCKARGTFAYCPIEMHSHNMMDAFFSTTDDAEETGLRIYAVVGHVNRPVVDIRVRVGIYGHFWTIPYEWIFESHPAVQNA